MMNKMKYWIIPFLLLTVLASFNFVLASKSKAEQFYNQGETYSTEGRWDLAADAFAQAAKEYPKYQDVQSKLENARNQAAGMLIQLGDEAKTKEKYNEALAFYRKALVYKPNSVEGRSKYDGLSQEMVAKYYTLGRTYESQNRLEDSFKEYEKAYMINPNYQDVTDRYSRIKAKLTGGIPARAILFFINRSSQPGIETPLIQRLQAELVQLSTSKKYTMIDNRKVQAIMDEQAAGLGDNLNDSLAMDLGRLLGADQVITGEITSEGKKSNKFKISARILSVPQAKVVRAVKMADRFSDRELANFLNEVPELAKDLAKKLAD